MRKAGRGAVVAATEGRESWRDRPGDCGGQVRGGAALFTALAAGIALPLLAAVLPDDRADALYHAYDGGGVKVTGPSLQILKRIGQSLALSGNYYVDAISSASIDVITTASPYSERRTETSAGLQYLAGKSIMSLGYTHSDESDFDANSAYFNISQSMFGDLTTVTLGYSLGWDTVGKTGQPDFSEDVDRQQYRVGLSQILSRDWIVDLAYEGITDEGFLNNPYRSVRYLDPTTPIGYSYEPEQYPHTRTSNAFAVRSKYFLPYRAALHGEYRFYDDTWGIRAHTAEVGYTHPWKERWIFDVKYRYYTQGHADFYSDLFPRAQAQNFLARDKELSSFDSHTLGVGASYEFLRDRSGIERGTLNLSYDHILFAYDDFRDLTVAMTPGEEPQYDFTAGVLRLYLSVWY